MWIQVDLGRVVQIFPWCCEWPVMRFQRFPRRGQYGCKIGSVVIVAGSLLSLKLVHKRCARNPLVVQQGSIPVFSIT